jgi:putative methionine-R-sulfoxide reductase with GAF domain
MSDRDSLLVQLEAVLRGGPADADRLGTILELTIARLGCTLGTVHCLSPESGFLELRAHRGIPEAIVEKVHTVPIGKGMAGLAAERREPVQVCNLQTDASGVARPAARQTGSQGSIAVPMLRDGVVLGVLGVGKHEPHEFTAAEQALLLEAGAVIARALRK